ncbi:MAG TPA: O-antigen ligase family protein [Candidatus Omnitrophota bacterium]|nr:O-antigen ligase family protein [Candidatus Omnitrophota bacterium]
MNALFEKIKTFDTSKWAVATLLVLWASTTFSIALMEIAFVAALVLWLLSRIPTSGFRLRIADTGRADRIMWGALAAFFLIVLASFLVSEYPRESFRGVLKIAKPLLIFLMVADLFRDGSNRRRFDIAFLAAFLIVTADSSIQYAFGKSLLRGYPAQDSSAGLRLVGPFGDFGKMGSYLILVIPVFVMRFWSEFRAGATRKNSFYALALALIAFMLLYLTRCRGPVVALVIAIGLLCLWKRWFKFLGLGVIVLFVGIVMAPRHVIIHKDAEGKEQSVVERFELWKRALDVIDSRPWLGTGINTYDVAHEKYDTRKNWRVRGYYAHNGYLQLAAEIGVPGVLFFVVFLVSLFRRGMQKARAARGSPEEWTILGLMTGLLAFLIYALSDTNLQSPQPLMAFWFLAGVLLALQNPNPSNTRCFKV